MSDLVWVVIDPIVGRITFSTSEEACDYAKDIKAVVMSESWYDGKMIYEDLWKDYRND